MNQAQLNKRGQQYLKSLATAVSDLWHKCCEHEGVEPGAPFVVFSKDNPYQGFYNQAIKQLLHAQAEYLAGGYVGLKIVDGKAR